MDGFGSSLYGSGLQSGSSPPGSARSNVKIEGGSSGGTGQSATLAQGQGLLVPITPGWDQGLQQPAPGECWPCKPSQCLQREAECPASHTVCRQLVQAGNSCIISHAELTGLSSPQTLCRQQHA